jgi:chemotaxis protein CheZ
VTSTPDQQAQSIRDQIQDGIKTQIAPMFDELRRFTDRRIAELSSEIHATVQLFDFGEANLSGQLAKIHEQVAVMVAMPAAATRNSGLELEAVVQATEAAANQIMEAAEAIGDWLRDGSRDVGSVESVAAKLNSIFEACTFQDVTGQRIRRAIQHLQHVETMLTEAMPHQPAVAVNIRERVVVHPDLVQDDVDRVFALTSRISDQQLLQAGSVATLDQTQNDIDQMFTAAPASPDAAAPELAQNAIDDMFGPSAGEPALPGEQAGKPDMGQDDVDRMFG